MKGLRVAIDGPSGVGKSTTARRLAERLSYPYLDTGAMYRAVGVLARRSGIGVDDEAALAGLTAALQFSFPSVAGELRILVDGEDLSAAIRTPEASMDASSVSRHPAVRRALVALQRALGQAGGVVMEGRDIGTVVMPDAEVKVFLDADPRVRGQRRLEDLRAQGTEADLDEVVRAIEERDHQDRTREDSPLRQAEDAIRLDTTDLPVEEVVDQLVDRVRRAQKAF